MQNEGLFKGSVIAIVGDNLGSHGVGGYLESFSAEFYCQYCQAKRSEIQDSLMPIKGIPRTPHNYNESLTEKQRRRELSFQGLKCDSIFNQLKYYHVAQPGLPPCIGHDLFEGVVAFDLPLILSYFIKDEHWFTYGQLNERIGKFVYLGSDASDKPCTVSESATRLSGHAIQNWVFLRLIPLLLYPFIEDKRNPVWIMLLKLKEIVEIVCAPTITESDVAYLNVCLEDYLFERRAQFPDTHLKP